MTKIISDKAIETRKYWVSEIQNLSGNFKNDTERLENEIGEEIKNYGSKTPIDHLRLCGNIPEAYSHDSSEEKLYSKYTDSLLRFTYREMGLKSVVLTERADVADVDTFAKDYSFVADAKAFRLSRTAKNQKDFKFSQWLVGNMANLTQWLFAQCISHRFGQVRFINRLRYETFAFSHIPTYHFW